MQEASSGCGFRTPEACSSMRKPHPERGARARSQTSCAFQTIVISKFVRCAWAGGVTQIPTHHFANLTWLSSQD
jgi:hypothetical protein